MKAALAVLLAVGECVLVSPVLYFLCFWFFVYRSIFVHLAVSGLILFSLGFACGRMAAGTVQRSLLWLPGLLLVAVLAAGWQAQICYMCPGGGETALTDVLFLFVNLVNRSPAIRHLWLAAALLLPITGSAVGGILEISCQHRTG